MLIEDYNHRDEPVEHHGVPTADRDICGASGLLLELNSSSSRLLSLSDEEVPYVDRNFAEKWNYQKVKYESDVRIPNHSKNSCYPIRWVFSYYEKRNRSNTLEQFSIWSSVNYTVVIFGNISCATDVNIEGPEDVLRHMMLLQRAYNSATKSAFEVRMVQVAVQS